MSHEMHHFSMGIWLLGLAFVVAFVGSIVGLACTRHSISADTTASRLRWLAMGSLSIGGVGIWLMHYIAMLGFSIPGHPFRYDLTWTLSAAVVSTVATFIGLLIIGDKLRIGRLMIGGVVMGIAVNAMHYMGMRALQFQGEIRYNVLWIAVSIAIAVAAATAALLFSMIVDRGAMRVLAGLIMAVAVVGMHYSGMAGVSVFPDASVRAPEGLEVFSFLFPIFVIGLLTLAVPIVAVMTAPDPETAYMDSAADDLAVEALGDSARV